MANKYLNTDLLDKAIIFAVKAHHNTERRGKGFPYIVHPMEAIRMLRWRISAASSANA